MATAETTLDRRILGHAPRRLPWVAFAAWVAVVIAVYYRRTWALAVAGPSAWVPDGGWYAVAPTLAAWGLAIALGLLLLLARAGLGSGAANDARRRRLKRLLPLALLVPAALLALAWPRRVNGRLLPWLGEAVSRNLWALAALALLVVVAYTWGAVLLRLLGWRAGHPADRLLFRLAAGFGVVSYLSLLLALAGWYRPPVVAAGLGVLLAGGLAWLLLLTHRGNGRQAAPPDPDDDDVDAGGVRSLAWMSVVVVAGFLAFVAALAPETEFDALWYHLWLPAVWLDHGRPIDIPHEFIALYPITWELVFGAGLATGGAVGAKLLHFLCLPLVALATWRFARRFLPGSSPWLAVAITVTAPTFMWEATTAYVDVALALYVILGLYALLVSLETSDRRWFTVAVICLGLATALKHLGLVVLAILAVGLFVHLARSTAPLKRTVLAVVALVAGGALFGAPWYLRGWLLAGNPFFPEMYALFGASPPTRWDAVSESGIAAFKSRFGMARTPLNLLMLPWNATIHAGRFGGALGPVFLAALPLMAWRARSSTASRWLTWLVVAYIVVWASPISSFQLRFLVPIVPAMALLASAGIGALFSRLRWRPAARTATVVTTLLLLLNLPPFIPLHEGEREGWDGWLTHVIRQVPLRVVIGRESEDAYLRERVATYGAWVHASRLPGDARVLEFGGGDNLYATREKLTTDAVVARDAWATGDEGVERAAAMLSAQGVTHVLIDKSLLPSLQEDGVALVSPAFRPRLRVEYEDSRAVLYRVEADPARAVRPRRNDGPA